MATPTTRLSSLSRASATLSLMLCLAACQQPQVRNPEQELLKVDPPAAGLIPASGDACTPLPADWLEQTPSHMRRISPLDCASLSSTPLFSWGEAGDRQLTTPWTLVVRLRGGGTVLLNRSDITAPRFPIEAALSPGNYEWAVSYTNTQGARVSTQWRRFSIVEPTNALSKGLSATATSATTAALPDGQAIAIVAAGKARPRVLPSGSSYAKIAQAAQNGDNLPVLNTLRAGARFALTQALPAAPVSSQSASGLNAVVNERTMRQAARAEREYMERLTLIGRLDGNTAMLAASKLRLLNLAAWPPTGLSSESSSDQTNREVYLALAQGLDMLWQELSATERSLVTAALRARVMQATSALSYLDKEPYESHGIENVRWINQALLLAVGLPGFPEAQGLLAKNWDLSRFTLGIWGEVDGSFGNGIAYGWYAALGAIPYSASVRAITGVDVYQLEYMRRSGEQMMAFTAPNLLQPSAFGDETETQDLYANYTASYYRLHAQMTRNAQDAWYWRVKPGNVSSPNDAVIWQLLLLGADDRPMPAALPPTQNSWVSRDAGLAALHVDAKLSARTSLFFRSSRFGAFNHSHADQNSVVYVSQGKPLLISAGYYPYYNSPHHKSVTRATRYKNALTYDGGFGQSESVAGALKPSNPAHSMDARGDIIYHETRGALSAVTGDAALAYRAINPSTGVWVPQLSNAVRSVVMDRASGVTLIYDWATSSKARQWELNFHSPNAFVADASTVKTSNGAASVCLDRHGPATSFTQTMAWDVPPETPMPAQGHARFTALAPSTELAHLTVLRDGCKVTPVQVSQQGTRIAVVLGNQVISFDKRSTQLPP
ncbi:heparinase II/III-family protein [Paucibacter sp. DJ1R-11]|uniref:heparinase II/III-family protein n=1 Tax=Paucibacter sp. DJ1R-11 TaxID=2893556 RepID=UPI0021E498C6|nr:heparinase II/III-family protein [Paucibacter sp. DJ1R-11]MCV2365072.1 heparinase II/III-family protein [Paucibacter sp. DJ1R-11]